MENHPLEKKYNAETNISVMLCEGKVVGRKLRSPFKEKRL